MWKKAKSSSPKAVSSSSKFFMNAAGRRQWSPCCRSVEQRSPDPKKSINEAWLLLPFQQHFNDIECYH